ncbi:MetQ/NlpA family ABC transporter substrate-binding protein [Gemmiger sp.]
MKKLISATLAASLALSLAACGSSASTDSAAASSESTAASSAAAESTAETSELAGTTLKVAASPTPHAEILNAAKDVLAEQGIDLEVIEFTEYVQPNLVTESGEVDANYFQHKPYLDSFNVEQGTHLVSVGAVHYEPFGIYPGKSDDLANIVDGATIAIPSDTTNEARALQLLATQGLITVRDGAGLTATVNDITENPHNIKFEEIEAAQLPRTVQDVDFAVINGNYALAAGFSVKNDALATEDASSEAAQTYANILAVKEGRENDPAIQALYAALTSDKVKDYINSTYDGAVVPIF